MMRFKFDEFRQYVSRYVPSVIAKIHFQENYNSFWMIYSYNDWVYVTETHCGYLQMADNYNTNLNLMTFNDD